MLDLPGWGIVIFLGLLPLLINELIKVFIRARQSRNRVEMGALPQQKQTATPNMEFSSV
jgi:hypothetical protein